MKNRTSSFAPFANDAASTAELLQGLISPVPAQSLIASPPDTPPQTRPGESTPVTGSLAMPPSQATPKVAPDQATNVRRGLAGYFSQPWAKAQNFGAAAAAAVRDAAREPALEAEIFGATNQPQAVGSADAASGRMITQPSDNPAVNQALATNAMRGYLAGLEAVVRGIPGARLAASRTAKNPKRLAEKIALERQPAQTVSDYGAAQIAVDSPQAKDAVVHAIKSRFPVLRERDDFSQGDPEYGYRAYSMQIRMPNGASEELQIVPREIQKANKAEHREYKAARNAQLAGRNADAPEAAAKRRNDRAMTQFKARNLTKGAPVTLKDGTRGVVAYLDPNLKIARIRTEDGRNVTMRRGELS